MHCLLVAALGLVPQTPPTPRAAGLGRRAVLELASTALLAPAAVLQAPRAAFAATFDPDRYGDKELKIATVNKIRQAVRNECGRDLELLEPLLQLALSDAFSYNAAEFAAAKDDKTKLESGGGGIDGSILLEMDRPSSKGLEKAAACVRRLHDQLQRTTEISYADVVAFAGSAAVEAIGGPKVSVQLGRKDATGPSSEGAREGFSWQSPTLAGLKRLGKEAALTGPELVSLVGALATLELAARPVPAFLSGEEEEDDGVDAAGRAAAAEVGGLDADTMYGKKRAGSPKSTDDDYTAKAKLAVDVRVQKIGNQPFDTSYFVALLDKGRQKAPLTPLEAELLADGSLKKVVEDFSKSKQKFREAFRETYGRLQVLGGNYRGAAAFLDDTADLKNN